MFEIQVATNTKMYQVPDLEDNLYNSGNMLQF